MFGSVAAPVIASDVVPIWSNMLWSINWLLTATTPVVPRTMRLYCTGPLKLTPLALASTTLAKFKSVPPSTPPPVTPVVLL